MFSGKDWKITRVGRVPGETVTLRSCHTAATTAPCNAGRRRGRAARGPRRAGPGKAPSNRLVTRARAPSWQVSVAPRDPRARPGLGSQNSSSSAAATSDAVWMCVPSSVLMFPVMLEPNAGPFLEHFVTWRCSAICPYECSPGSSVASLRPPGARFGAAGGRYGPPRFRLYLRTWPLPWLLDLRVQLPGQGLPATSDSISNRAPFPGRRGWVPLHLLRQLRAPPCLRPSHWPPLLLSPYTPPLSSASAPPSEFTTHRHPRRLRPNHRRPSLEPVVSLQQSILRAVTFLPGPLTSTHSEKHEDFGRARESGWLT